MTQRLNFASADFSESLERLLSSKRESDSDTHNAVEKIIADIREHGDVALLALTAEYDRFAVGSVTDLTISCDVLQAALEGLDDALRQSLELAAARIKSFHEKQLPDGFAYCDEVGVQLAMRHTPVDAVGLYVPGGKAAYPSSVLMNAIPAMVAGVKRRVMAVPASDGDVNDLVLAAAALAGVTEVWLMGGAQAVAALAYGTESIAPVDKIVGPGNAFVAAAKRQVFGQVGIDSIAGPSEILVVADAHNEPAWIAADLLSQAEHDEAAQSILITDNAAFADAVDAAVSAMLPKLDRAAVASSSWQDNGAIITVPRMDVMPAIADKIAAEHVELALDKADEWAKKITHAGAIFLGRFTPEAIGDYIAGPNHVLPTARTARFSSGLGVADFLKRTTLVSCDAASFAQIAPAGVALAEAEGLGAHALSMRIRMSH